MEKNQDYAGTPFFMGDDADAIKARASAFEEVEQIVQSFNPEDPTSFIAVINEVSVTMLASSETLPNLAYSLMRTLISIQAMAKDKEPSVQMGVAHALVKAMEESGFINNEEVNENDEQSNSNISD